MAQRVRIECINKTDRTSPHERIRRVGGTNADNQTWRLTLEAAIAGIETNQWSFFVQLRDGTTVDVVVATHLGHKYLKTKADGIEPDNLLALPECA